MFCGNCGKSIDENNLFCTHCGARIDEQGDNAAAEEIKEEAPAAASQKPVIADEQAEFQRNNLLRRVVECESSKDTAKKSVFTCFGVTVAMIIIALIISSGAWVFIIAATISAGLGVFFMTSISRADAEIARCRNQLKRLDQ